MAHQDVVKNTRRWLEQMVVGLNLCPFSHNVIVQDQVHYAICDTTIDAQLKQFYVDELQRLPVFVKGVVRRFHAASLIS
ncbi:DUF1415 family protein, partial [Sulfitobacter sp.]|uniref:DUF1415 family protein n=1 Tax=Sulfitobacter sp. TaxID=1903071 RepID=UPI00300286CE